MLSALHIGDEVSVHSPTNLKWTNCYGHIVKVLISGGCMVAIDPATPQDRPEYFNPSELTRLSDLKSNS